jgi:hypothetical protein
MTTVVAAMWVHGNAIVAEHPEHILALDYRGWGPELQLKGGTRSWFHLAVPTPLILGNQRGQLVRIFLCFNTPERDGHISQIHVYDGADRVQVFENLFLVGDCRAELRSGANTFPLPSPRLLYRGLGLSFLYQAASCAEEPCPASYLSIAAAGADFLVEEPLHEASAQQLAQSEREGAALRETATSQSAQLREIITWQHSQHESVAALLNETEALKGMMLPWQQRADTLEHQLAALQTRLHEEVQAREALAQQVAAPAAQKMTPRRKKQEV